MRTWYEPTKRFKGKKKEVGAFDIPVFGGGGQGRGGGAGRFHGAGEWGPRVMKVIGADGTAVEEKKKQEGGVGGVGGVVLGFFLFWLLWLGALCDTFALGFGLRHWHTRLAFALLAGAYPTLRLSRMKQQRLFHPHLLTYLLPGGTPRREYRHTALSVCNYVFVGTYIPYVAL